MLEAVVAVVRRTNVKAAMAILRRGIVVQHSILRMTIRLLMRRLRNMRRYRPLIFIGALITLYIVISNSSRSTFPANLRGLGVFYTAPWPEQSGANAGDRRPRALYRQINESTKMPTYGLFFLLDLDSTGYIVTSQHQGGDILDDRAIEHDFGFSSCHQVSYIAYVMWCDTCYLPRTSLLLVDVGLRSFNSFDKWLPDYIFILMQFRITNVKREQKFLNKYKNADNLLCSVVCPIW